MSESPELEFLVLSILDQTDEPVGSGAIGEWVRQHGLSLSEATVGRYLRQMDLRGMTVRDGFRGRSLAMDGQQRLSDLRRERAAATSSSDLVNALRGTDQSELVDVLVARRALEREIACLAATRVTERDLVAMEVLIGRYEAAQSPGAAAEADFAFHERLSEVAGNKVLQAATRLIHAEAQMVPIPDTVQRQIRPTLVRQHWELLEALRDRDAARAEAKIVAHLDCLIESVQRQT